MADIKTPEERSKNMAAVHGKDTKPEVYLRKLLYADGYRYRKNYSKIVGHPDIYLSKYHTAIFVHGCFWHRHKDCKYATTPKTNVDFWNNKFRQNIERDEKIKDILFNEGIKCLVVWECTIKEMHSDENKRKNIISEIEKFINSSEVQYEEL